MAGLQTGVPARNDGYQGVQTLVKKITYLDYGTTVTVGKIPAGASVIGGGVHVTTAFNSSSTDTLNVGFVGATTDADGYATLLLLSAVGYIALDELAATTNIQGAVEHTVTCAPAQGAADATAGEAWVIIQFVATLN
jgi:hypothetical protein